MFRWEHRVREDSLELMSPPVPVTLGVVVVVFGLGPIYEVVLTYAVETKASPIGYPPHARN